MKIIDEKGRLFGKVNVIDFLVILFLFSLAPMFYFGYRITREKPRIIEEASKPVVPQESIAPKDFMEIELNSLFIKVRPEMINIISVGDKEVNEKGDIIGEIVKIGEFSPYIYKFNVGAGRELSKKDSVLKQVPVTLKIKAEIRQNHLYYRDRQIIYDGTIEFKTPNYQVETVNILKDYIPYADEEQSIKELYSLVKALNTRISDAEHEIEVMLAEKTKDSAKINKEK